MRGALAVLLLLSLVSLAAATPQTLTFQWTYGTSVPNLAGFQLMKCEAVAPEGTCAPTTGITGTLPPETRTAMDTGTVGHRYCWGTRALAVNGPHSGVSNAACATIQDVSPPDPPSSIPVPTDCKKVP
jgi:hypothetical protein